tara:strand:- start:1372 stop:2076 length:705 start_codon:yes stop_codon:yes gene_type:complete
MAKRMKEKFKTFHDVFDAFTNRNIYKLITEGHFEGLIGPVSIGKESNVFQAKKKDGTKVIVKIYRLETCDFNRMFDYIRTDPRFMEIKKNRRKVIFAWAQREYRNLLKARDAGVRVPTPYAVKNNVLVMEFIGGKEAAPKLKDAVEGKKQADDVIKQYRLLYSKAGLVHSDFSHFNILNDNGKIVLIDLSAGTPLQDPNAKEFFERDIKTLVNFYKRHGVVLDREEVMAKIKKG